MTTPPSPHRIHLRWRDLDTLGHVTNSVYLDMFTEARINFLESIRPPGAAYVVARTEVDFLSEVRLDHGFVDLLAYPTREGTKSVTVNHEMRLGHGTLAATCLVVLVGWDRNGRCSRELSEYERERLMGFLADPVGKRAAGGRVAIS